MVAPTKGGSRPQKGGKGSGKGKAARAPLPGSSNVVNAAGSAAAGSAAGKGSIHSGGTRTRGSKGTVRSKGSTKKGAKKEERVRKDGKRFNKFKNRKVREPWRYWARYIHKLHHADKDDEEQGQGGKKAKKAMRTKKGGNDDPEDRLSLSARSVKIIGSFCEDMFDKIVTNASQVCKMNNGKTITAKEIQTSVRLLLPSDFAQHSISEGTRAMTRYQQAAEARTQEANMA